MNIYQMNETDWVAAMSLQDAIDEQVREHGEESLDSPRQLTEKELDTLKYHEDIDNPDDETAVTFREKLKEMLAISQTTQAFHFAYRID